MRTKKKNYNEYRILDEEVWVRNFTLPESPPVDQNEDMYTPDDLSLCLLNETQNYKMRLPQIGAEQIKYDKVVIISDGYNFNKKKEVLMSLPRDVAIIGTNNVLNWWTIGRRSRPMTYYICNNPYTQCMRFLPKNKMYYPPCIASVRTNASFIREYLQKMGLIYLYTPVSTKNYSGLNHGTTRYAVDDYRNPVCAAISLAYRFGVKKLLLFCHDDCFAENRPAAILAENNLWAYPQQQIANHIIDAQLSWLTQVQCGYNAEGLKLNNASYIPVDQVLEFFSGSHDGST